MYQPPIVIDNVLVKGLIKHEGNAKMNIATEMKF